MTRKSKTGMRVQTRSLIALVAAATASSAASAVTLYDDRASFIDAADGDMVLETFEQASDAFLGDPLPESGLMIAATNGWTSEISDAEAFSFNTTPGGEYHVRFGFGVGSYAAQFMHDPMTSFGFDLTGYQDLTNIGAIEIALYDDDTLIGSYLSADPGNFLASFHGITSETPFNRVDVIIEGGDYVGFDDILFQVAPVPAPSALALFAVAAMRRRRRA